MYFAKKPFSTLILGSVFSDYVAFYGDSLLMKMYGLDENLVHLVFIIAGCKER